MLFAFLLVASALSSQAYVLKNGPTRTVRRFMSDSELDSKTAEPTPAAPAAPVAPKVPKFDPKQEAGVSGPFGFFDPLGICPPDKKNFMKYRESEIKHGRIAMLAFLGFLFGESGFNFLGGSIVGPGIYQYQQAEALFNAWSWNVVGFALAVEGFNIVKGWQSVEETLEKPVGIAGLREDYTCGDLRWDPLGLKPSDPKAFKTIQTKEINNGRLAMLAVAGIVAQELVTDAKIF